MTSCEQTPGQNILEHGQSVKDYLFDLVKHLKTNEPLKYEWNLPKFIQTEKKLLLDNIPDDETLELYTTYHDCGKPFCMTIDDSGKKHFPDHSKVSYDYFKSVFNNPVSAELVLHDMDIHTLKAEGVKEFSENPNALTLILAGLAEIHSNARMFGGNESTSFKIKHKQISKKGEQIIKLIKK